MSEENFGVESFAAAIEAHVNAAPLQDTARGQFSLGGRIVDAVRDRLSTLGDGVSTEVKTMILNAALKVYDKFNFPQIPDAIELPIKATLRPILETLLKKLLGLE